MTTYPASTAQVSYLSKLIADRAVPADLLAKLSDPASLTSIQASFAIDRLKTLPWRPRPAATVKFSELDSALADIPAGRYAFSAGAYNTLVRAGDQTQNDLVFIRVREYRNRKYIDRVVGGMGMFTRYPLHTSDLARIARYIGTDPLTFGRTFAHHFTACARCLSPLTDQDSRDAGYGPDCRKALGI
jgi:hypothetical protein